MRRLMLVLLLVGCAPVKEDIEAACTDLVRDYAYHRDRLDAAEVANLFTEDAKMSVLGQEFDGRGAIERRMLDGKGGPVTRHLMSTIRIFPESADRATGVSYVTVYISPRRDGDGPLPVEGFGGIGEYHDVFERTSDGWKIAARTFVPVFAYEDQD